jgi:two-component SAPR family response regulator
VNPHKEVKPFSQVLSVINRYLADHPDDCLTLFFHYKFETKRLKEILKAYHLFDKIWVQEPKQDWPSIEEMVEQGKQLVCFSHNELDDLVPEFGYMWDYMVEPFFSTNVIPEFHGQYYRGDAKSKLLLFNGFNLPKDTVGIAIPWKSFRIDENPYLISHCVNMWKQTGKRPNYFVLNQFNSGVLSVLYNLNVHRTVSGAVTYNRTPLTNVRWERNGNAITSGDYSFPLVEGEDIFLKPKKPGFSFIPEEVQLTDVRQNVVQNFIAIPLQLDKQLVAYYPFDKSCRDISPNKLNGKCEKPKFINDLERGWVIDLSDEQFITLPTAEEMQIRNNDFTVSAWVKVKDFRYRDLTILGTEENYYRKGLHLQLRNKQPYFGFFANDLIGSTIFKENKWYHVVWRYTKFNGEQAIFVNGKSDGSSLKHPAFMGLGNLMVGKSINMKNYFIGRMDELCVWNRPLGDEEIWNLYQEVTPITTNDLKTVVKRNLSAIISITALLIAALVLLFRKRIRKMMQKQNKSLLRNVNFPMPKLPEKNVISLFGDFHVLDKNGEDVSERFTPKIRQLFLLILLYSQKSKKGISSEDLTQTLWPDMPRKSAINNRGVNLSKLRNLLDCLDAVEIVNTQEHWQIKLSGNVFCDYVECVRILHEDKDIEDINIFGKFFGLIQNGSLLKDSEFEWLDEFKGYIANEIIDMLLKMISKIDVKSSPETVIQLCDRIFAADELNEDALEYKVKALIVQNNYNMAKYAYRKFAASYEQSYGESFARSFNDLQE